MAPRASDENSSIPQTGEPVSSQGRVSQRRAMQQRDNQRKKEHVESLKHQLDQLQQTADKYRALQAENNALREYALKLRTELLWSQGTLPDPPNGISLAGPHTDRLFAEIKALLSQENENAHETEQGMNCLWSMAAKQDDVHTDDEGNEGAPESPPTIDEQVSLKAGFKDGLRDAGLAVERQ
ncbi:hypothetical protein HDK64DRAFT_313925 [Phyllosticta capitalensis]|uniref:BZIP domain-containing protein n=1 Tax=Phyllosticta capitalensis TaxID=121624 RepID=A0ABR1Y9J7_9PEZI